MFNVLKLSFKKKEYLLINSYVNMAKIKILDDITVFLQGKYNACCIGEDDAMEGLQNFIFGLTKSIEKQRMLVPHCICQGKIGLQAVKEFVEIILNKDSNVDKYISCLHQKYNIFGYKNKRASWLYNDMHGNIVLEVTPWFDVRKYRKKTVYEKWIKNYKPILKRIIEPKIAQQWIEQMQTLLRTIRENSGLDPAYDFMADREKT